MRYWMIKSQFEWKTEIQRSMNRSQELESQLFEGIDPAALKIVMQSDGETKRSLKTTLTLKGIQWEKDYRLVKLNEIVIEEDSDVNSDGSDDYDV